jgi:ArsR family transcriptional regulator
MATAHGPNSLEALLANAARNFAVLSAPIRLRVLSSLCHGEKNVGELLADVPTTQPNMSQHLTILHRAGFVTKRRYGNQIYYAIADSDARFA